MPSSPKRKPTKKGLTNLAKSFAPGQIKKAKAIFKKAKSITPNQFMQLTPKSKDMLAGLKKKTSFNNALSSGALKLSDLNKPISQIIKKKLNNNKKK